MTLEYSIDNSTFRDLVDEAMRKVPGASRGNWTHHAPVDPGITLIELFAWLLEQRSYLADQVTPELMRPLLALLGEQLRPARAARTVLTLAPFAQVAVPARTTFRIPETDIVYTLRHGITALPLASPIVFKRSASSPATEVVQGRPIELLPSNGDHGELWLGFRPTAPMIAAPLPLSVLFELDSPVLPQWSPDRVDVRTPADVAWEAIDPATGTALPVEQLQDGTRGFRRSGVVRFSIPAVWATPSIDPVRWLKVRTEKATFSSPPAAVAIALNSALAWNRAWLLPQPTVDDHWLPLPRRTIQLDATQLPLPERTVVFVAEAGGPVRRWRHVDDFSTAGPADRVFIVDRSRARIMFGDGLNGKLPRLDRNVRPPVRVLVARGGGERGNVGPACVWEALDGQVPSAINHVAAIGGADAETLDDARLRVTGARATPTRAVTADDHEQIARATPGVAVARAHAEPGFDPDQCGVVPGVTTVFVVPALGNRSREQVRDGSAVVAPACDPGLLDEVRDQFARTRIAGEQVRVEGARYQHIRIRATVNGAPYDREGLRSRLAGALRELLDPLLGGGEPANAGWPFGAPVRPSALLGVAQREVADRGEVVSVAVAREGEDLESCDDLQIRPFELVAVGRVEVVFDPMPLSTEVGLR